MSSRLREDCVGIREFRWSARVGQQGNTPAGCSKRPDFSPAQPRRAETRLVPSKAATPRLTLVSRFTPHVSRFTVPESHARTLLADFFSILLELVERLIPEDSERFSCV